MGTFVQDSAYVTEADGYVTAINDVTSFANAVINAGRAEDVQTNNGKIDLSDGYWVMSSPLGNAPIAFTVIGGKIVSTLGSEGVTEIKEKSGLPSIEKSIDKAVASMGETVTYTVTIKAAAGQDTYTVTDALPAGITNVTVSSIVCSRDSVAVNNPVYNSVEHKITWSIEGDARKNLQNDDTITITYTAKVDKDAGIAADNTNTATLAYGIGLEKSDSVAFKTYQLQVTKTDGTNALAGAKFKLTLGGKDVKLVAGAANEYFVCADTACLEEHITEVTTDATGIFVIKGLGNGEYTLEETAAPAGYTKAADKTVQINNDNAEAEVVNIPGQLLPETGGMGTTALYAVGAVLMLGAVAVLAGKKKVFEK